MSTEEKFIEGQRVALKEEFRHYHSAGREGVVTHYENYHGVRVWIKADDNLYYAYPEDSLELLEEVDLVTHFTALTEAAEDQKVGSIMISRRLARGLLDCIAELEAKVAAYDPDKVQIGDRVKIVRDDSGMLSFLLNEIATVVDIEMSDPAPVVIKFGGFMKYRCKFEEIEKVNS